jgi:putative PIN family toxin of toxin-antitoxin system
MSSVTLRGSVPSRIVDAWFDDRFVLLTHPLQLEELRAVTRRPRVRALIRPAEAGRMINQLRAHAEFVGRLPSIRRSEDPADDFLLAMCQAGQADFLVTGDKAGLLDLGKHGNAVILTARALLDSVVRS